MNRRKRERKAYLRQKEMEAREADLEIKKREVSHALDTSTKVPHSLRPEASAVVDEIIYDAKVEEQGFKYPRILVTSSRDPSSKLLQFTKHLALIFNGTHMMRGQHTEQDLSTHMHTNAYTTLIIAHENKGTPSGLIVSHFPHGPTLKLTIFNFSMNRRLKPLSEKAYFIADNFVSELGIKIKHLFSALFPMCTEARRIVSFICRNDLFAFRHYLIDNGTLMRDFECDLKLYEMTHGTFEMKGDVEWIHRPFINTAKTAEYFGAKVEED